MGQNNSKIIQSKTNQSQPYLTINQSKINQLILINQRDTNRLLINQKETI